MKIALLYEAFTPDWDAVDQMVLDGMHPEEVAAKLGVRYDGGFRNALKARGGWPEHVKDKIKALRAKRRQEKLANKRAASISGVFDKIRSGMTAAQIADEMCIHYSALYKKMKNVGVPDDVVELLRSRKIRCR